jgi:hypothetical protein
MDQSKNLSKLPGWDLHKGLAEQEEEAIRRRVAKAIEAHKHLVNVGREGIIPGNISGNVSTKNQERYSFQRAPQDMEIVACAPTAAKAQESVNRFISKIPYAVAERITRVVLYRDNGALYFAVEFIDGKRMMFHNVDVFPTDSDLGMIALSCP